MKGVSKLGFHPTGWPQKFLGSFGAFVAAKSLPANQSEDGTWSKKIPHFHWTPVKFFFKTATCQKLVARFHSSPPYTTGRSLIGGSPLPSNQDLTRGREDSYHRLRFVTQANLSPWYVELTTVSSVVKDQYKECRCCELSIVFFLRRSLCTVPALAKVARTFVENYCQRDYHRTPL